MSLPDQKVLTTKIVESKSQPKADMTHWPEYKCNVKGLVYLEDFDGICESDETIIPINIPANIVVEPTVQPQYQCIKCGKIHSNQEEIHRMKCSRCYNKAFNKIRPTKWVKFNAY